MSGSKNTHAEKIAAQNIANISEGRFQLARSASQRPKRLRYVWSDGFKSSPRFMPAILTPSLRRLKQFLQRPHMVGHSCGHRWRCPAYWFVLAAEVIPSHEKVGHHRMVSSAVAVCVRRQDQRLYSIIAKTILPLHKRFTLIPLGALGVLCG